MDVKNFKLRLRDSASEIDMYNVVAAAANMAGTLLTLRYKNGDVAVIPIDTLGDWSYTPEEEF